VDGIIVQLPLPDSIDEEKILAEISPEKDVDGFHPENFGKAALGIGAILPCTPQGVIYLLKASGVSLSGKHAVVIGRSRIVGKPLALLLLNENCTVTVCHSRTQDIGSFTRMADIICVAVGKPNTLTADMVKEGAIVIDVGMNREGEKLIGDVDFAGVSKKASLITPVPGGVGPMTRAMLVRNTLQCFKHGRGHRVRRDATSQGRAEHSVSCCTS
jgi:methylenetetrahydrofolate dehydrogenase (NADP+)/methenyltetrahydrofolate cyclohydrolase